MTPNQPSAAQIEAAIAWAELPDDPTSEQFDAFVEQYGHIFGEYDDPGPTACRIMRDALAAEKARALAHQADVTKYAGELQQLAELLGMPAAPFREIKQKFAELKAAEALLKAEGAPGT